MVERLLPMASRFPQIDVRRQLEKFEDQGLDPLEIIGTRQYPEGTRPIFEKIYRAAGDRLYAIILGILTYRRFDIQEAKFHWENIIRLCETINLALGRNIGVRVAAMDYLQNQCGILKNVRLVAEKEMDRILDFANKDGLTTLFNHRFFQERLSLEIQRSQRTKQPTSLIMMDIDNFKHYNDHYGHGMGDQVIRLTANLLRHNLRNIDIPCRYGGDEFALILPGMTKKEAGIVAERIRQEAERARFPMEHTSLHLTLSIGVATCPTDTDDRQALVEMADSALYLSKRRGRNRVSIMGESSTGSQKNNQARG